MAGYTCEAINDLFVRQSPHLSIDLHNQYIMTSLWGRLIKSVPAPLGVGTSFVETTPERIYTGEFEDDWDNVDISDGVDVNAGCIPTPKTLDFGTTQISWTLQHRWYKTPCICLDDLKSSWQIQKQVGKTFEYLKALKQNISDNRRRSAYLNIVKKFGSGDSTFTEYDTVNELAAAALPSGPLVQDHIDAIRIMKINEGAGENAFGMEDASPVLGLVTSAETSRALLRQNPELRKDIRFAKPNELVRPLGVERSYGGFYHLIDFEIPRFKLVVEEEEDPEDPLKTIEVNTLVRVYPRVKVSTTKGFAWKPNPDYHNPNVAKYEAAFILHRDAYHEAVQQVGPKIPGAEFKDFPFYYNGMVQWMNILHEERNPKGKIGRWTLDFINGVQPIKPYLGAVIIHERCVQDYSLSCTPTSPEPDPENGGGDGGGDGGVE